MKVVTIGLDLAKNIFQVHGVDREGHPLLRKRLRRLDGRKQQMEVVEHGREGRRAWEEGQDGSRERFLSSFNHFIFQRGRILDRYGDQLILRVQEIQN
jgi:hypothetical protein